MDSKGAFLIGLALAGFGCATPRRRAGIPSDLRDAPAALPRTALRPGTLGAPTLGRPSGMRDPVARDFASQLALWHQSMQKAIDSTGGFSRMPENLRLKIGVRLSAIEALYDRGVDGRMRPRPLRFAGRSPRELLEWIEPVQRFYHNAIEPNRSLPQEVRRSPSVHYQALERYVRGRR